jgi:hypothetical protein
MPVAPEDVTPLLTPLLLTVIMVCKSGGAAWEREAGVRKGGRREERREQRAESREQRAVSNEERKAQRAESREQRAKSKEHRTEAKEQRAWIRKQLGV